MGLLDRFWLHRVLTGENPKNWWFFVDVSESLLMSIPGIPLMTLVLIGKDLVLKQLTKNREHSQLGGCYLDGEEKSP